MKADKYYTDNSDIYDKYRFPYNKHLAGFIREVFKGSQNIVEFGAGTGHATEVLSEALPESKIIAVEPSIEMLKILHSKELSNVSTICDVGERYSSESKVDLAVAAMSLHWMDTKKFLDILKAEVDNKGKLMLLYCSLAQNSIQRDLCDLIHSLIPEKTTNLDAGATFAGKWVRNNFKEHRVYSFREIQKVTVDDLIEYMLTFSYSPDVEDTIYDEWVLGTIKIFNKYKNEDDMIDMVIDNYVYITECNEKNYL